MKKRIIVLIVMIVLLLIAVVIKSEAHVTCAECHTSPKVESKNNRYIEHLTFDTPNTNLKLKAHVACIRGYMFIWDSQGGWRQIFKEKYGYGPVSVPVYCGE